MLRINVHSLHSNLAQDMKMKMIHTHAGNFKRIRKVWVERFNSWGDWKSRFSKQKKMLLLENKTFEGKKPPGLSSGHLPRMVALGPRSANRALRYLHHAGIRMVLPKFG